MRKLIFPVEYSVLIAFFISKFIEGDDYSFQYPCYSDVCTFPREYCESTRSEKKCNECVLKFCETPDMPQACKFFCDKAARSSEKKIEGSYSTGEPETGVVDPVPWIITSVLSAVCIGLIVYILAKSTTVRQRIAGWRRRPRNNPVRPASSETEMKVLVDNCHEASHTSRPMPLRGPDSRTQVVTSSTQL